MGNRLLPSYAPPKEGRTPHSPINRHIKQWRRTPQARILAVLFGLAVTYFLVTTVFISKEVPLDNGTSRQGFAANPWSKGTTPRANNKDQVAAGAYDERIRAPSRKTPVEIPDTVSAADKHKELHTKPSTAQLSNQQIFNTPEEDKADFLQKLQNVIDLLPDDVTVRELVREPSETGKERLREMGLRTRSFTTYFAAWEALHLVLTGNGPESSVSSIRDDVVQRIHSYMADEQKLAETVRAYEQFREFFHQFANLLFPWISPYWPDHLTMHAHLQHGGRGLVLSTGDYHAPYLITSISSFRKLGCTLPIEVMYLGENDLDETYRQHLEALPNVITRDLSRLANDSGWELRGWASKPMAILMSSFREVIFIDADSLFFEDPANLFDDPGYVDTGALFFRDRALFPESKKKWLQQILPPPISRKAKQSYMWTGKSGHYQEAGVVVVDKWRHFAAMLLVTRMNGPDRDGNERKGIIGVYDLVYGDKETYWLAWELAGDLGYSFHQGAIGLMGSMTAYSDDELAELEETPEHVELKRMSMSKKRQRLADAVAAGTAQPHYRICAPQLLHAHVDGRPLWFNGWVAKKKLDDKHEEVMATFEQYLVEPGNDSPAPLSTKRDEQPWELHPGNICCLTADHVADFNQRELGVLKMIVETAREVVAQVEV